MIDKIETAKMSERGQIIIPKGVRDHINAKKSTIFAIMPVDSETIVMKKLDKKTLVGGFGIKNAARKEFSKEIEHIRHEII